MTNFPLITNFPIMFLTDKIGLKLCFLSVLYFSLRVIYLSLKGLIGWGFLIIFAQIFRVSYLFTCFTSNMRYLGVFDMNL